MSSLTAPESELASLKSETHSIESLLDDVLQRQSLLLSRLDLLQLPTPRSTESPANSDTPGPSTVHHSSWTSVVKKGRRISLPLFSPDEDTDSVPVSNFFAPLEKLIELAATDTPTVPEQPVPVGSKAGRKRRQSPITPVSHGKWRRCLSPPDVSCLECAPASLQPSSHLLNGAPVTAVASGDVIPSRDSPGVTVSISSAVSGAPPANVANDSQLSLSSKFSVYTGGCKDRQPEILIVGDSIIRSVELPGAITYCLPGAKVTDIIELSPVLIDRHPSAHILIVHESTNDVMDKESVILRDQLKSLAITTQSLGRTCIFSGPIPAPSKSPEHFSRLYSLHEWLKCFCTATGHGFISNFDCFWTRYDLFKPDGLHPNRKGTKQLAKNFIQHIAFNWD